VSPERATCDDTTHAGVGRPTRRIEDMFALTNKVAIITGASSGIGRATAKLFAEQGAKLVVAARRQAELDALVAEIADSGGEAIAVVGDVQDEAFARTLVERATGAYGGLDVAFNNAGIVGAMGPVSALALADWRETLDTNLTAAFLGAKYQVPALIARGGGSLIFTSTFVGHTVGMPGMTAYAASKAGLIGLTQVLAAEFGPKGVRVNALLPGGTDTPASITNAPGAGPEVLAFVEGLHALKRMARPEEIARSALYLASDASSFTTGIALLADGGVSINRT
jgi:NAD(P)-dependent dehydrogenase (short-subunit alcohol dehydrogenase family)